MKTLEENRYKKTYNSDARRVAWFVNNNLSEDYETMPISMRKKWSKAQYGRERYLAKEFLKSLKAKLSEQKLRKVIRGVIKEQLNEAKMVKVLLPIKDRPKIVNILQRKLNLKITKHFEYGGKKGSNFIIELDKKFYNKFLELLVKNKINPRG